MGEFLKGWRRKTGCVALMLAWLFTGLWIRGESIGDLIEFEDRQNRLLFGFWHRCLFVATLVQVDSGSHRWQCPVSVPNWEAKGVTDIESEFPDDFTWHWRWLGFRCGNEREDRIVTIPYWSIVAPLTLLSAYLLLNKPPKIEPKR